jgi:predicted nucleic acid-binding protein
LIYLDTSVVVAYYCPEPLSGQAERYIRAHVGPAISDLTEVEIRSALSRKVRRGELQVEDARKIASRFTVHIEDNLYRRLALERRHYELARDWLGRFDLTLRALDALHLAVAASEGLRLVTADEALARSAKALSVQAERLQAKSQPGKAL